MIDTVEANAILELVLEDLHDKGHDFTWVDIRIHNRRTRRRRGTMIAWPDGTIDKVILYPRHPNTTLDSFENTVRHELAHVADTLENPRATAHGPSWREWCGKLGAMPKATASGDEIKQYRADRGMLWED